MNEYSQFNQVMDRCGATGTPEDFHAAVNVTFHKWESTVYDQLHQDMWDTLPEQFNLLVDDYLSSGHELPNSLKVLDVGCGTGLASECLLATSLANRVRSIDLLDTSAQMLSEAAQRAKSWNVPYKCINGLLGSEGCGEKYDVVLTCSVLHHLVDLAAFLNTVTSLQSAGGIFLHLQDPNGDYLADPVLNGRMTRVSGSLDRRMSGLDPRQILKRAWRKFAGSEDYISRTNDELLASGVITKQLTVPELFSVTDVRVHDGHGVSIKDLRSLLSDYRLISQRSYGFFGELAPSLPKRFKEIERREIAAHTLNGFHLGAVWVKAAKSQQVTQA